MLLSIYCSIAAIFGILFTLKTTIASPENLSLIGDHSDNGQKLFYEYSTARYSSISRAKIFVKKCNSNTDCNEMKSFFCIDRQCLKIDKKVRCKDNDDCNEISVYGHEDGRSKNVWLKCIKGPDDPFGHCHPANTKYIQIIDEFFEPNSNRSIRMNNTIQNENSTSVEIEFQINNTRNSTLNDEKNGIKAFREMKQILIHHFRQVTTLHFPKCKLLNQSSPGEMLNNEFLHYYHESLFNQGDVMENIQKACGVIDEFPNQNSEAQVRTTTTRYAMAEGTLDEEIYPIPPCGYGICDNPEYRKKYFSFNSIKNSNRTRIIFIHFHVFPKIEYADARIAASVRRMNDIYRHGNILFLSFVSSYNGKYSNAKLSREQEIDDCIKAYGKSNCVLDYQVIEEIYGKDWRKRGSFHILIGPLYHPGLLGWSHFPWVSLHGLIVIGEKELDPRSTTLAHEIGHAVGGLHHVFRGRESIISSEPNSCHSCIEHEPSDWTGDLCKDTNPTPEYFECRDPTLTERPDICNPGRRRWEKTPYANIMSYAPSNCHIGLTRDQFERIHCWISQYRNAYHMLNIEEEQKLSKMMTEECYTKEDGSDYRGKFDDFGSCKSWPSEWWNVEKGILPGDNACRNPNPNVNGGLWCFYKENGESPTLCSLSGTILFLNTTCQSNPRYDARYINAIESFRECFTHSMGADYRGTYTESYCVNWPMTNDEHGISTEHRYCRNPVPNVNNSHKLWCFTQPGGKEPRYCNLDMKTNVRNECPRIPPNSELKSECYSKDDFSDYRGRFNNYGSCDMWPLEDPEKGVSRSHNFCRNPDNSPSLWCYENSYTKKAIFCDTSEVKKFQNPNCSKL